MTTDTLWKNFQNGFSVSQLLTLIKQEEEQLKECKKFVESLQEHVDFSAQNTYTNYNIY